MVDLVPVESGNISAVGWDRANATLYVKFTSGSQYAYSGVPEKTFNDFLKASSKGKFFAKFVRDKYPTRHV
jgi:hypothetical protein